MHIDELQAGMVVLEDIYVPGNRYIPLIVRDVVLNKTMIDELRKAGVMRVRASKKSAPVFQRKRERVIVPKQPTIELPKHGLVIQEKIRGQAISGIQDLFNCVRAGENDMVTASQVVKSLDGIVDQLVDTFLQDSTALININDLKSYDEYTYHHSLSVAVLSIAIGQSLKFDRKQLSMLGKCAMMHDIGKTKIPIDIINKPSRLSNDEFNMIKLHSPEGYRYMSNSNIGDAEIWKGVLFHHEKYDGTGYPMGLKGDQIPIMSRIISVADVYDALTSNRPYRIPMQPAEAVEYLMGNTETMFDHDIVVAFLSKIELYPIGSLIVLSNNKVCEILDNENPMRPIVKLVDTGEILDLYRDIKCLSLIVKNTVPKS